MSGLRDALERLVVALPGRVYRVHHIIPPSFMVQFQNEGWESLGVDTQGRPGNAPGLRLLEYALREEVESRGWGVNLYLHPDTTPTAEVIADGRYYMECASTPAEALAGAVLRALEGRG